jgi:hypothetical protein
VRTARALALSLAIAFSQFIASIVALWTFWLLFGVYMIVLAPFVLPAVAVVLWFAAYACARLPLELLERAALPAARRSPISVAPIIATRCFLITLCAWLVAIVGSRFPASFAWVVALSLGPPVWLGLTFYATFSALVAEPAAEPPARAAAEPPAEPQPAQPPPPRPQPARPAMRSVPELDQERGSIPVWYPARLWKGRVSLPETYWVWTVLGTNVLLFASVIVAPLFFVFATYTIFIAIALWRSANNYDGHTLWSALARACVVPLTAVPTSIGLIFCSDRIVRPIVRFLG